MKSRLCGFIGLWILAISTTSVVAAVPDNVGGEWVGGSNLFDNPVFISMRFTESPAGMQGTANIQSWRVSNRPFSKVQVEGSQLSFELPSTTGIPFVGEGKVKEGVIEGTIRRGEQQGKFHLVRVANIDRKLLDRYVGAFRFPDPKTPDKTQLSLITYSAWGYLRWINLDTGDTTALYPMSDTKFFFAFSVIRSPSPEYATWEFEAPSSGEVTRSTVRVQGQPDNVGLPTKTYRQELVSIKNGKETLAATLVMPSAKGKHPVVIFVPGSGALSREESAPFREFEAFINNRVGLLIYDKRGTGLSTGDWQRQSFDELASDVLAAVDLLKRRKDVDTRKIGAWGFSQGGSIAPLAASRSKDIAFLIIASGGGIAPSQAEMNEQIARMRVQKLSAAEIDEALAFMKLQFEVVRNPNRWDEFRAAAEKVKDKKWYRYTWGGLPKDHWQWKWWGPVVDFDPTISLSKIKVPVLVLFGALDQYTPAEAVAKMAETISTTLARAGNRDVTTKIFPNADHDFFVKLENGQRSAPPDYHETLSTWLKRHVTSKLSAGPSAPAASAMKQ